jgi:hypothetical protein
VRLLRRLADRILGPPRPVRDRAEAGWPVEYVHTSDLRCTRPGCPDPTGADRITPGGQPQHSRCPR